MRFDAEKTAQALGYIMGLEGVSRMNIIKALKLLYIADREALREAKIAITGDSAHAMKHGPVLSRTYDLMKTDADWPEMSPDEEVWTSHFTREHHDLVLNDCPGDDRLSRFDRRILEMVYKEYGSKDQWALRNLTHEFTEWRKNEVGASSAPIPLRDILLAVGVTETEAEEIASEHESLREADRVFAL